MKIVERTERYKNNLLRIAVLRKAMIDAEINWLDIREKLNLSQYDFRKLKSGELETRESEVWDLIESTPQTIIERDKTFKTFQKALIDRGFTLKELCEMAEVDKNRVYRALRKVTVERDIETEKKIEQVLGVQVF